MLFCSALHFILPSETCLCLDVESLPPVTLSPSHLLSFFPLCPYLFFSMVILFCSACPSGASRPIGLCFSLNERSVEAGWRINKFQASSHSSLSHLSSYSLSRCLTFFFRAVHHRRKKSMMSFSAYWPLPLCMLHACFMMLSSESQKKHLCTRISRSFEKSIAVFLFARLCVA